MKLQRFIPNTKNFSAQYCRYVKRKQTVTLNDIMAKQGKKTKFDPLRNYSIGIKLDNEKVDQKTIRGIKYTKVMLVGEYCWVKDIPDSIAIDYRDYDINTKLLTMKSLSIKLNISIDAIHKLILNGKIPCCIMPHCEFIERGLVSPSDDYQKFAFHWRDIVKSKYYLSNHANCPKTL